MKRSRAGLLIMDACVVIDFLESDRTVIRLISETVGQVHVPLPILREEIAQLGEEHWADLGIVAVEPSLETATAAASRRAGLSFYDHLCLLIARDKGWTCVTNDGHLRRQCAAEDVPVIWGLETVALLVDAGALKRKAAAEIGQAIQQVNPRYITPAILTAYLERIGAATTTGPRRPPRHKSDS